MNFRFFSPLSLKGKLKNILDSLIQSVWEIPLILDRYYGQQV